MRLLLDTHVAIWALAAPALIPLRFRDLIDDPGNTVHVSAASVWEIAIKFSLGKRGAPPFSGSEAIGFFAEAGYQMLPISAVHTAMVEQLPPLHADPFDRLLIAQALAEPLRLITHDPLVAAYSDATLHW